MKNDYDHLKLENQLCFPLYAASKEIIKNYGPLLKKLDLTYTQYITLMVLWDSKRICVKDLGKKLFLDSGTLSPVLKSLEKKGYVMRERGKDDERMLFVSITADGEALKNDAVKIPEALAKCVNLTPEESVTLYTLLYKLLKFSD